MKAISISFNLYSDVDRLVTEYQNQLDDCNFMIDKIKGSHFEGYNRDLIEYTEQKHHLEEGIKKLKELQSA